MGWGGGRAAWVSGEGSCEYFMGAGAGLVPETPRHTVDVCQFRARESRVTLPLVRESYRHTEVIGRHGLCAWCDPFAGGSVTLGPRVYNLGELPVFLDNRNFYKRVRHFIIITQSPIEKIAGGFYSYQTTTCCRGAVREERR